MSLDRIGTRVGKRPGGRRTYVGGLDFSEYILRTFSSPRFSKEVVDLDFLVFPFKNDVAILPWHFFGFLFTSVYLIHL